ncbi:MAG: N-acetylmuramoyl-L-alanine amidase [Nitratireductor sp.]|nr:N-acetylmuramoyl-L-alanine amidase [Nitratireductor sp.]
MHYTGMDDGPMAQKWLCMEESQVSCHYIVHEDGRIVQMVAEDKRAWHAGAGSWQGREDVNSRSIGIEIVNGGHEFGHPDFPQAQIEAVTALSLDILSRHAIAPRNVLAHSDIAPGRKRDPGEKFPWRELHQAGIGHWVEPVAVSGGRFMAPGDEGPPVRALQEMLSLYGYGVPLDGRFGLETGQVVTAFQRHFRPQKVDGIADASSIETLHRLLAALPGDTPTA